MREVLRVTCGHDWLTWIQNDKEDGGVERLGLLLAHDPQPCHISAVRQTRTRHLASHTVVLLSSPHAMAAHHNSLNIREVDIARRRAVAVEVDSEWYRAQWRQY